MENKNGLENFENWAEAEQVQKERIKEKLDLILEVVKLYPDINQDIIVKIINETPAIEIKKETNIGTGIEQHQFPMPLTVPNE